MSEVVIFDTSVLVDEARTGRHRKRIETVEGVIRSSSVVLAELLRGVSGPAELKFLRTLARNHPVLTPTRENWLQSGEILAVLLADQGC
jgi:predicted nucleic acid-binding protein